MPILTKVINAILPLIPKTLVGYVSRPYIAGETLEDAVQTVRELNASGAMATIDLLGESVTSREESLTTLRKIETILHAIEQNELDSNISIKPTQLGLMIDAGFCEENIRSLCRIAKEYGNFVRIDMEDHPYTTVTLEICNRLRREFEGHVGTVLQAYLRRTESDARDLLREGKANLRLCKGIYNEPSEIAYKDAEEIRENFSRVNHMLMSAGAYVGVATHDDILIEHAKKSIRELNLSRDQYEFQMLLGVRPKRRNELLSEGHRTRVYVPFGDQWYAYSVRRLKENPHMAGHIVKAFFGLTK